MIKKADSLAALPYFARLVYHYAVRLDKAETRNERLWLANTVYSWASAVMKAADEIRSTVYREEGVYDHGSKKDV